MRVSNDRLRPPHVVATCLLAAGLASGRAAAQDCGDVRTQMLMDRMEGHTLAVRDMRHHPTANMVATASFDKTVRLWVPKPEDPSLNR